MLLRYGNYSFPFGQVEVIPSMETERDESGRPVAHRWTITISGLLLNPPTVTDANSAVQLSNYDNALRAALSLRGQDLVLFDNYGQRTSIDFRNGPGTLAPMQCIHLDYPDGGAGEYVTKRQFRATFQIVYESPGRIGTYTSYRESVQVFGSGGRMLVWQPAINGPPVPVQVYPETTIRLVISGSATGYNAYPVITPPRNPSQVFMINPSFALAYSAPRWMGSRLDGYRDFPVQWTYIYEGRVSDLKPNLVLPRAWPVTR